ncbi:arylsulfatase J-like [Haemaphysalis longicornis]
MPTRDFVVVLFFLASYVFITARGRPHIVVIMVEDLGWADVGFHGSRQVRVPNIDALAADGIILHKYYTLPYGVPSKIGFLTGVYPYRTGITKPIHPAQPTALPVVFATLPNFLKPLGYATHFVGVWNLGFYKDDFTPDNRGFDTAFAKWSGPGDYWTHVSTDHSGGEFQGFDLRLNKEVLWNLTGVYATHAFTQRALRVIADHDKTKPLFLVMAHQGVHTANQYGAVQCPTEHLDKFARLDHRKRILLCGALAEVDKSVGQVFRALHKRSMLNNTVLVFASTSGGLPVAEDPNSNWSFNSPLRGTKGTYFEGGVRVPAFIWSPLLETTPRVSTQLIHVTDWLPTLLHVAGGDSKVLGDLADFDSFNQWPALSKNLQTHPRKSIVHNFDLARGYFVIMLGDYKGYITRDGVAELEKRSGWFRLVGAQYKQAAQFQDRVSSGDTYKVLKDFHGATFNLTDPTKRGSLVKCSERKAANCKLLPGPSLFNLALDPCEQCNVIREHPHIMETLKKMIAVGDSYVPWESQKPPDPDADPGIYGGVWVSWRNPPYIQFSSNKTRQDCHFDC